MKVLSTWSISVRRAITFGQLIHGVSEGVRRLPLDGTMMAYT